MKGTIFRYPGGKSKAIKFIKPFWESCPHNEYREPFVGGGSVFIAKDSVKNNWINDKDKDLIAFYKIIKNKKQRELLIEKLLELRITKSIYNDFYYSRPKTLFEKAIRYYYLNRCSFSGITKWNAYIGGPRWNIKRNQNIIRDVGEKLKNYRISSLDFEKIILEKSDEEVFLFIDPPYAESRQVAAYNIAFNDNDHIRLFNLLNSTNFKFLLTYDDCEFIRNLYKGFNFFDRTWTYSIANSKVHHNPRESGNELFITNFSPKFLNK